jgi:hypothetical protein
LFHNLLVQDSVFNMLTPAVAEQETKERADISAVKIDNADPMLLVLSELQNVFAHMRISRHGVVDLNFFVGKATIHLCNTSL